MPLPSVGQVVNGYAYTGGDPNAKTSWRWVGSVGPQATSFNLDANAPGARYLPRRMDAASKSEEAYFRAYREKDNEGIAAARKGVARARRAEGLMSRQKTGGIYSVPVVGSVAGLLDPEIRELDAIQAEVARSKRQPGEGAISDFDAQQFLNMTYGKDKPTATNRALIQAQRIADDAAIQRRGFMEWHYNTFGSTVGAEEAWDRYAQDNPIFAPETEARGAPVFNARRQNWREYFGAVRSTGDRRATTAEEDIRRASGAPAKPITANAPRKPPPAASATYNRMKARFDPRAPMGDQRNPFLARDAATLQRLEANMKSQGRSGVYVITPEGHFAVIE